MRVTPLEKLRRVGSRIKSPFEKLGSIAFSSWIYEVLPDVLWSSLIVTHLDRHKALSTFRNIITIINNNKELLDGAMVVHSQIGKFDDKLFDVLFSWIANDLELKKCLAPLLLVESLPDRTHWKRLLGDMPLDDASLLLSSAIAECFDHQSQAATDCRWFRVMTRFAQEKIRFDRSMDEKVQQIVNYPNMGDMRSVRPSIRAMEMVTRADPKDGTPPYNELFWDEFWRRTECIFAKSATSIGTIDLKMLFEKVVEIDNDLAQHFSKSVITTKTDPRHDGAFGLVFYLSHLLLLSTARGNGKTVVGRLILRTAVEVYITLSYLVKKDDETIWLQFRNYGNGQNKLSYLKYINLDEAPSFISSSTLEEYLNEDIWHEYLDIKLGAWDGNDLRRMATDAGEKEFYDRFYDVLSGYTHGNWMAVMHLIFGQCLNPLHRFHRMPIPPRILIEDAVPDLIKILNLALDRLNAVYPTFKPRLHAKSFVKVASEEFTSEGS